MYKSKIIEFFKKKTEYKFLQFSGRTNTQIWQLGLLIKKKYKNPVVLMPSTLCVSPSIIFTTLKIKIKYVDVDIKTGLIDQNKLKKILENNKINVLFYANLFGNLDDEKFYQKLKNKNILIIQDLAQTFISFNKKFNNKNLFGDVILLSFGYSKIFDIGKGAILLTNNNEIDKFLKKNTKYKKLKITQKEKYYKMYLNWYHFNFSKNKKIILKDVSNFSKNLYLLNFSPDLYKNIYEKIINLSYEEKRRNNLLKFYRSIFVSPKIKILHSKKTLIPWRFCFRVKKNKSIILQNLRKNHFDASSYYLSLSYKKVQNSMKIENEVINLWLTEKINKIKIKNQYKIVKKLL